MYLDICIFAGISNDKMTLNCKVDLKIMVCQSIECMILILITSDVNIYKTYVL